MAIGCRLGICDWASGWLGCQIPVAITVGVNLAPHQIAATSTESTSYSVPRENPNCKRTLRTKADFCVSCLAPCYHQLLPPPYITIPPISPSIHPPQITPGHNLAHAQHARPRYPTSSLDRHELLRKWFQGPRRTDR